jgi:hypothetical protein
MDASRLDTPAGGRPAGRTTTAYRVHGEQAAEADHVAGAWNGCQDPMPPPNHGAVRAKL